MISHLMFASYRKIMTHPGRFRPLGFGMIVAILMTILLAGPATTAYAKSENPALLPDLLIAKSERDALYAQLTTQSRALRGISELLKTAAKLTRPTVVHIEADVTTSAQRSRGRIVEEAGSGVILKFDDHYYIMTNSHVIFGAKPERIKLTLADGRQVKPLKILVDPPSDVAVIRIEAPRLVASKIGASKDIDIGDFVLAIGSPFGLSQSVTFGIVSATGRRDLELGQDDLRFQDFIQTDAAINPGNSGGPLINLAGEVIGINTAIASSSGGSEGIGFAIPIDMAMYVARQLVETGKVTRAYLGVTLDAKFTPPVAARFGLPCPVGSHITSVRKNSPAAKAGIKTGDVILEFDGVRIQDDSHLINQVALVPVGKLVKAIIWRDKKPESIDIIVGNRETP